MIYYQYSETAAARRLYFGMHTPNGIKAKLEIFEESISMNKPLTVNGPITINNEGYDAAYIYNPNSDKYLYFGQSGTQGNCCFFRFRYCGNNHVDNSLIIGFHTNGEKYDFSKDRIYSANPIYASNFVNTSDRRLKENINELSDEENIIDKVKVYSFNLKNDTEEPKRKHYGVIAQELEEIAPELVYSNHCPNGDDILSVNYIELIPHLINKIHQQDKRINELEAKINKFCGIIGEVEINDIISQYKHFQDLLFDSVQMLSQ